jgi:fucose 4-O-acetylase-like acetyltransferase
MIDFAQNTLDSKILAWLRFPLAVLVVAEHTQFEQYVVNSPVNWLANFFTNGISYPAVAAFFFISGYLFFAKYQKFGLEEYTDAMKRKAVTLLLPYLLWLTIAYYFCGLVLGFNTFDITPLQLRQIYWDMGGGVTVKSVLGYTFVEDSGPGGSPALWFVRDLMVMMLCTPLIWTIVRHLKMWTLALVSAIFILNIGIPVIGFNPVSVTFFAIGATLSICGKGLVDCALRYRTAILVSFALLLTIVYVLDTTRTPYNTVLIRLLKLSSIGALILMARQALRYKQSARIVISLGQASFFVYIFHDLPFMFGLRDLVIAPTTAWGPVLAYMLSISGRVIISLAAYYVLRSLCPRVLSFLVGGRADTPERPTHNILQTQQ